MQRKIWICILALALIGLLLLCAGCSNENDDPSKETASEKSTLPPPVNEDMKIETPYCSLTIPFAFSELVTVERNETDAADSYVFSAALENRSVPVYTIHFVSGEGDATGQLFGTLKTDKGDVRVLFEAPDPDKSLTESDLESFYSAQETINDVFNSLKATPGFTTP